MHNFVELKAYAEPEINKKEILRYAGGESPESLALLDEMLKEVSGKLTYKVCYRTFPIIRSGEELDLGFGKVSSNALRKKLDGCDKVVVFAATIGLEMDRLIARYGKISPSKALMLQAIGAERIESLCDVFNAEINKQNAGKTKPRFSPGYGDFPLEAQKDIFAVLDCPRKIGATLNSSLLMSPSKSVTAIIGIGAKGERCENKCAECENKDCSYRSV